MGSRPASTTCFLLLLLLLLVSSLALLSTSCLQAQGASSSISSKEEGQEEGERYVVPARGVVYRRWRAAALPAASEAPYEPLEVCDGCRCCAASDASACVDTSCCYAIDCDVPGKPFGVCAFTPRACGCGAGNNCTQPPPPS